MNNALDEIRAAETTMIKTLVIPHDHPENFSLFSIWERGPLPAENCTKVSLAGYYTYILYDCRNLEFREHTRSLSRVLEVFRDRPNDFVIFRASDSCYGALVQCIFEPDHDFDEPTYHTYKDSKAFRVFPGSYPDSTSLLPMILEAYAGLPRNF